MQVIFTTQNSILSAAIRTFEGSEYSHCAVILPGDRVIEATWNTGVRERGLESMKQDAVRFLLFDIALPNEQAAIDFATAQLGKKYDKTAIFGFPFMRDWEETDTWYCSELVAASLEQGGFPLAGASAYHRVGVRLALEFCQGLAQAQIECIRAACTPGHTALGTIV